MTDEEQKSPLWLRVALVLGVTMLPVVLVIGAGFGLASGRAEIWQFALQLCLFVIGGSIALILSLMAGSRLAENPGPLSLANRWVAAGVYTALILATLYFRDHAG